jgi:hypothetical protein
MEYCMKKSRWHLLVGMLVITLTFGLVFVGCKDDEPDVFDTPITDLAQLKGTWNGSFGASVPNLGEIDMGGFEAMFDGISVSANIAIKTVIDASTKETGTQTVTVTSTMTFSGGNIDAVWGLISGEMGEGGTTVVDNSAHSITTTDSSSPQPITLAVMKDLKLNQNGNKIEVPAKLLGGIGGGDGFGSFITVPESLVFVKQ